MYHLDKALLVALPLLTFACDKAEPPAPAPTRAPPTAPAPAKPAAPAAAKPVAVKSKALPKDLNVILLTVDALRADMPWAGYVRDVAPNLSALAKRSVELTQHRANTSFTAQSIPTILSGRLASTLYRSGYFFAAYSDANEFFPEALSAAKVRTIGLHSHMYFDRDKGLEQGFDVWEMVDGITYNEKTDEHVTSERTTRRFIELLSDAKNTSGRFFAWTHYMDPHHQYVKHADSPDFGRSPRDVYDNEVHHTDHHIGEFLKWAEKQPWWSKTALIVSADHGEAFGEHGLNQHAHELWEELVRVPLLVHIPGVEARKIASRHTHLDLAPTIMELMGQEPLEGMMGKSFAKELVGGPASDSRVTALELAADNIQDPRRAVIVGKYKLIRWGKGAGYREQLFDLEADPGEKKDLAREDAKRREEMSALLDETFAKIPSVTPYGGMKLKGGGVANGPQKPQIASL